MSKHNFLALFFTLVWCATTHANASVEIFIGRPASPDSSGRAAQAGIDRSGRFSKLDTNRDGTLSTLELEAANRQRTQAFVAADENKDGLLTKQEWQQFKHASSTKKKRRKGKASAQQL